MIVCKYCGKEGRISNRTRKDGRKIVVQQPICTECFNKIRQGVPIYFTKEFLQKEHIELDKPTSQIAIENNITEKKVINHLKKYNIKEIKRCKYCDSKNVVIRSARNKTMKESVLSEQNICEKCWSDLAGKGISESRKNESEEQKLKRYKNLKKYYEENPEQKIEETKKKIETWENKPIEDVIEWKNKISETKLNRTEEQEAKRIKRYSKTMEDKSTEEKELRSKRMSEGIKRYSKTKEFKNKRRIKKYIKITSKDFHRYNEVELLNSFEEFLQLDDYSYQNELDWKCKKCGNIFKDAYANIVRPRCLICDPISYGTSKGEQEVACFISQFFKTKERKIKDTGVSIDIFVPELNLAIEYNGVYTHSELYGLKNKYYHLHKTEECEKRNIQLIHILDKEWHEQNEIVKSMLLSKMGKNEFIYQARKCEIKLVNKKISDSFCVQNHIQGKAKSSINIGLYYNNDLVSLMTFGKSRYDKNYDWELLRFCNKLNSTTNGGFSKLLKYFRINYNGSIISYANRRFSIGSIYEKNGFTFIKNTTPNYFYTKRHLTLESRLKYQKHKLSSLFKEVDMKKTEWEIMQENGYDRIWDCGNKVYVLK